MDKEKYIAIFMTTLMIALPIGAVMTLIVYEFGVMAVPEHKTTYDFIKDHGSLIAGFIGLFGVGILVIVQMRTTMSIINSSREDVIVAIREKERSEFYKNIRSVHIKLGEMMNKNVGNLSLRDSDFNYLDELLDCILIFLKKNKLKHAYFTFLKDFLSLYQQKIYTSYSGGLDSEFVDSALKVLYDANICQLDKCLVEYNDINNSPLPPEIIDFFKNMKSTSYSDVNEDFFRGIIFLLSTYYLFFIDKEISLD
ncbi:hypothetical protein B9T21_10160 [Wohlfahrtiimonas chitiniclastica]|uniref:hypothetical protein n=1 Tax=Wohlfahrtiimonas chitiniclastica TaxID=400946 RepID=UPI000B98E303|nr:hypothetical protein [Wohlfahrtiimonas chitiniclastica]OYQ84363.1 hypothetical protein B9T21_10160 [Wohlfahrtiimonas chitiniclastica]